MGWTGRYRGTSIHRAPTTNRHPMGRGCPTWSATWFHSDSLDNDTRPLHTVTEERPRCQIGGVCSASNARRVWIRLFKGRMGKAQLSHLHSSILLRNGGKRCSGMSPFVEPLRVQQPSFFSYPSMVFTIGYSIRPIHLAFANPLDINIQKRLPKTWALPTVHSWRMRLR